MPDDLDQDVPPIEFLTENGFSIFRPWEIDRVPPPTGGSYLFLVRSPEAEQRKIQVEIGDLLVAEIAIQTRRRIQVANAFWVSCSERHLANYLWKHGTYPPNDRLDVTELDAEEMILAISWGRGFPGEVD